MRTAKIHEKHIAGEFIGRPITRKYYAILWDIRKWLFFTTIKIAGVKALSLSFNEGISIDVEKELVDTLKKRQFVETNDGWKAGFVRVILTKNTVHIGHDIKGNKLTLVSNPLLTLNDFINYFNRI